MTKTLQLQWTLNINHFCSIILGLQATSQYFFQQSYTYLTNWHLYLRGPITNAYYQAMLNPSMMMITAMGYLQCFSTRLLSAIFSPTSVQTGLVKPILARSALTARTRPPLDNDPMFTINTSFLASFWTYSVRHTYNLFITYYKCHTWSTYKAHNIVRLHKPNFHHKDVQETIKKRLNRKGQCYWEATPKQPPTPENIRVKQKKAAEKEQNCITLRPKLHR